MWARIAGGVALCVIGIVWIGQGLGAIGGSFMTDQRVWAIIGAVAVVLGVGLFIGAARR
jgi:hypothetical protein